MRLKRCILPILGCAYLSLATTGFSQVGAAALSSNLPLTVGAGFSHFNADWDNDTVDGKGLWIDYYPGFFTRHVAGLGVEVEARDLCCDRALPLVLSNFRQDTAGGGIIYSWHHFANIRPYAKGLYEYGSFDFNIGYPYYHHDSRSLYAYGAGLDVHVWKHFWARGDYEYQQWQRIPGLGQGDPTPNGFTLGGLFDFRSLNARR